MNKWHNCRLIFLLSIAIIFSGCVKKASIIFSEECSAPCWRQITPGKTSKIDALSIIIRFPDIDTNDLHIDENTDTVFSNTIVFKLTNEEIVRIYLIKDIVVLIKLEPLSGTLTFEKCIRTFGTPEYAAVSVLMGAGIPFGATSAQHTLLYGIYIQQGIVIGGDTYKWFSTQSNIAPKTEVLIVDFFDPGAFDILLENFVLVDSTKIFSREELAPWNGYGNVSKLYTP
jgi:hypothetical protein